MKVLDLEKLAVWTFMMMTTTTCALGSDFPKAGAADDALFWSGKTYVQLDALSLPSEVLQKQCPLHDRDNRKKKYLPSLAESMQYNRYGTLLSFLLRRSFDAEKKNTSLPVVLLKEEGRVIFKTDNRPLFDFSLEEVEEAGWTLEKCTFDLHHSEYLEGNIMTEYEEKFVAKGNPICMLQVFYKENK